MRDIRFRAWDKDKGLMMIQDNPFYSQIIASKIAQVDCGYNIELMQYTGLPDMNGDEIYDGDIIEWGTEGYKTVVEWREGAWWTDGNYLHYYLITGQGRVIGNIYDNPELLETEG